MVFRVAAIVLMMLAASAAKADELAEAAGRYRIDPSSVLHFSVAQMGGGGIAGTFPKFSGIFVLDGGDIARSKVDFTLDANAIEAGDPRIGEFIRSDAVFDAGAYPKITYRSTSVTRTGPKTARIDGQLTARGITRNVGFDVELAGRDQRHLRFRVTGRMSRALFGMEIGTPIYSNRVEFVLELQGTRI